MPRQTHPTRRQGDLRGRQVAGQLQPNVEGTEARLRKGGGAVGEVVVGDEVGLTDHLVRLRKGNVTSKGTDETKRPDVGLSSVLSVHTW